MSDGNEQYQLFLRSLDNSQLALYINSLSQSQYTASAIIDNVQGVSSLINSNQRVNDPDSSFKSIGSVSSDPFDDGLDEVLLDLVPNKAPSPRRTPHATLERVAEGSGNDLGFNEVATTRIGCMAPASGEWSLDEGAQGDEGTYEEEEDKEGEDEKDKEESESEEIYDVGPQHGFGDYTTYFRNKHLKQQKADEDYVRWDMRRRQEQEGAASESYRTSIFRGCIIHVNGHTVPSMNEIHRLVIIYGGKFISYLTKKTAATHIICDRLTPRKRIQFKNYKVVKAQWIVDSIASNKLLNWFDYRLIEDVEYGQQRLDYSYQKKECLKEDENILSQEEDEQVLISSAESENELEEDGKVDDVQGRLVEELNYQEKVASKNPKIILDARHPDFLKHFFANSRLHHLSAWKSELRLQFLRRIIKEKRNSQPKLIQKKYGNKKVILHIDFDCFFATASCLNYPDIDINKDPIAVTHGGSTSDIASCNYVARQHGVKNGMWIRQANKLCPNLIKLDYDFDAYEKYSNEFYNYLISLEIFDSIFPVSIDEALVDATAYCFDHDGDIVGTVYQLSKRIREDIFKLTKCPVSVGTSHNVLLAKLALRKAKPNNQFHLHEHIDEFLASIPVKDLPGIGHSIEQKLVKEIDDLSYSEPLIEDLRQFSRDKLISIFGNKTGIKLYQYARGIDDTSIELDISNDESVLGRKSISVDVNFGIRFDTVEQLDTFLINLAKELYSRLIRLGICGSSITLRLAKRAPDAPIDPPKYLGMGRCDFVNKSARLGVANNDWGIIGSELKALYRMVNIPVKELRGVSVTMSRLEDVENLKKTKQMKLPFNHVISSDILVTSKQEFKRPTISTSNFQDPLGGEENMDWEVFNALPDEIKQELQIELIRRGIFKKSTLPTKRSTSLIKNTREKAGTKAYLQQLIPSQTGSSLKYVRVIKSPTKSPPKKQRSVSKTPPPVKLSKKASQEHDVSCSYDSSVLNELPSSVRNDVLKDLEYKKKIKKFDLVPLKDKISKKYEKTAKSKVYEITPQWIANQARLISSPKFLNKQVSFIEMKCQIEGWISMSLKQKGPHVEDVKVFVDYLKDLLYQHNLNRCLTLISCMKTTIKYEESLLRAKNMKEEEKTFILDGINDWKRCLSSIIEPVLENYCNKNNIDARI